MSLCPPLQPFQQQPSYYPGLVQTWAPAPPPGQNYYELSNVFSANGLAPQVPYATSGHVPSNSGSGSGATAKGSAPRYTSGGHSSGGVNSHSGSNGSGAPPHRANPRIKRNNGSSQHQMMAMNNGGPAEPHQAHIVSHRGVSTYSIKN